MRQLLPIAIIAAALGATDASARDFVGLNIAAPLGAAVPPAAVVMPPPVVVAPPPVYYAPPAYYYPAPVAVPVVPYAYPAYAYPAYAYPVYPAAGALSLRFGFSDGHHHH